MDYYILEEQNIIEEPVVKRGRGRPRVIKQPKEPKKRGRPRIERPPTISQKRWRKPNVRTGEPQEKQPKERPKFIQLDVSDILKMLNTNFENTVMVNQQVESQFKDKALVL